MKKKLLLALPLAFALAFSFTACDNTPAENNNVGDGGTGSTEKLPPEQKVTTYDVTVVDGTIKGTVWNHQTVEENSSVTVVAYPESDTRGAFEGWTIGDATEKVGTATEYKIDKVTSDITITAHYAAVVTPEVKEKVAVTVVNGTIKGENTNQNIYDKGTSVTVVPDSDKGTFEKWMNGETEASTQSEYTFTADRSVVLTATFAAEEAKPSVWSGDYPDSEPEGFLEDEATHSWHITSADALAFWANKVTCNADGTDKNLSRYSVLDESTRAAQNDDPMNYYHPERAWTLYLETDVDLDGYPWTPINSSQWSFCGLTFNGLGHTISNLYVEAQNETTAGLGNNSAGFFGCVMKDDLAIRNVTFDGARIVSTSTSKQNMAVVLGYVSPSYHWMGAGQTYFGTPQSIIFDNVHVINSIVGDGNAYKDGLFVGRSGAWIEDEHDAAMYMFTNCSASDCTVIGTKFVGGYIGYACHGSDGDIAVGGTLSIIEISCTMTNVTLITANASNDVGLSIPGTLVSGDHHLTTYHGTDLKAHAVKNIKKLDLHCGAGAIVGTAEELSNAICDENYEPNKTEIFVACDIDITKIISTLEENFEADPETKQVIYLLDGAQITGGTIEGIEIRKISGERDGGSLVVTNEAGSAIGKWVIGEEGKSASYVANN